MLCFIAGGSVFLLNSKKVSSKLKKVGYSKEEIEIIENKLNDSKINEIIDKDYNSNIVLLIQEKFFREDKMELYLNYIDKNNNSNISDVISIVNAGAHKEFYNDTITTDMSKGDLILVNKFYKLDNDYSPNDVIPVSTQYAYSDRHARKHVLDAFIDLWTDAKKEGYNLIINSGYRDLELQTHLYNSYSNSHGKEDADTFSARPRHSEHETGLAIDLSLYGTIMDDFDKTEAFKWVKKNAHNYGFILRYPKDKEHITGFIYEPWHYRYVGIEVAKNIYDLNITFDEYYELFVK